MTKIERKNIFCIKKISSQKQNKIKNKQKNSCILYFAVFEKFRLKNEKNFTPKSS